MGVLFKKFCDVNLEVPYLNVFHLLEQHNVNLYRSHKWNNTFIFIDLNVNMSTEDCITVLST